MSSRRGAIGTASAAAGAGHPPVGGMAGFPLTTRPTDPTRPTDDATTTPDPTTTRPPTPTETDRTLRGPTDDDETRPTDPTTELETESDRPPADRRCAPLVNRSNLTLPTIAVR